MGVNVGGFPVSAFIAIVAAVVLVVGSVYARRRGHLRSRAALIVIAVIIAFLIIYGMGLGLLVND